jgi:hypothetical protein
MNILLADLSYINLRHNNITRKTNTVGRPRQTRTKFLAGIHFILKVRPPYPLLICYDSPLLKAYDRKIGHLATVTCDSLIVC